MKKNEKLDKLKSGSIYGVFYTFWGFLLLFGMLFIFSIVGHCASEQYYFPMQQNENGNIPQYIIEYFNDNYSENYYVVLRWWGHNASFNEDYIYFLIIPKTNNFMVYGEISNNAYQFSLYNIGNESSNIENGYMGFRNGGRSDYWNGGQNISGWQSLNSSSYDVNTDFASNFIIITNNTESAKPVLLYDDGVTIPDDDTARDDMEKPNIQDYIPDWSNKPTFDNSSVESALESVYDGIIWLGDNIKDTITGTGEYIADTVRWAIQKIINIIRSKIDEIKGVINDVKEFVSDIKDFVEYVAEPLDVSTLQTTITGSTAFGDISTITGSFADFKAVFDNTSEPNEYKIPLHLENISILGQTQTQYIDLGIIASQRPLIRAFCWVVTTFSLFVTVIDALPNYLKGGDE